MIAKHTYNGNKKWDEVIEKVEFSFNNTKSQKTDEHRCVMWLIDTTSQNIIDKDEERNLDTTRNTA